MGIAASTLLPIEEVVARVATEVSVPARDPKGLEVYSTAAQLVAEMIAEAVGCVQSEDSAHCGPRRLEAREELERSTQGTW